VKADRLRRELATVLAIARADFRERSRRYAFLVALALTAWLGWLASNGTLRVELGPWRGVIDSAWVGGSLAIVAAAFLSLLGGWLVRGTITRDRATGVGEILATTPLSRPAYLLGKWLSHFVYLGALALILGTLALAMLLRNAEAPGFDPVRLWLPTLLIALPALAFVAGLAVALEVLPLFRSGFGNVAWLFVWAMMFVASIQLGSSFDFSGLGAARASMRADLRAERGVDEQGFRVGGGSHQAHQTFVWHGFHWTGAFVSARLAWVGIGALLALAGVPFFDRFDPSRRRVRPLAARPARAAAAGEPAEVRAARAAPSAHALPAASRGPAFAALVRGQLVYALRGRAKLFWIGALALAAGSFAAAPAQAPPVALAWIWPVLLWSRLGAPDPAVAPVLACCPRPVMRPLLAAFVGGSLVGALFVAAPFARAALAHDSAGAAASLVAAVFPPALALTLGAWAQTPRVFEALYTCLWYVGAQTPSLDFMGATATPNPWPFAAAVPVLLLLASLGRARSAEL
jgi:hypothetical protein